MGKRSVGILASMTLQAVLMFAVGVALGAPPASASPQQEAANPAATSQLAARTDATREELANFDRFLDSHPILERELGSNPSLVDDPDYVQREPDLKIFLTHHPAVKAQLKKDPQYLARRMDFAEANPGSHAAPAPNPSLDQEEASQMHEFLASHTDIKQLLAQNPALINDSTFLGAHAELKSFLGEHPRARYLFVQNPRYFISPGADTRSGPVAAKPAKPAAPATPKAAPVNPAPHEPTFNFSVSSDDIARMDQFLEDHPKIARDMSKDPLLVANHHYLDHHHELREFFEEHVRVREAFAEDPRYFVPGNGFGASPPPLEIDAHQRLSNRDLAETETFLLKHKDIAKQMRGNPMVVQDLNYLHHHGDLRAFLDQHPHIQTELDEHPRYFMRREEKFQQSENFAVQKHK